MPVLSALHPILLAIIFVSLVGILAGLGLAIASYFLAVQEDPKALELTEELPGANCGACGYSGCAAYAAALAAGSEKSFNLCAPGGSKVARKVASLMGGEAVDSQPECAQVLCQGNCEHLVQKFDYKGIKTCAAMALVSHGPGSCDFGCLGLGDCAAACPFDAISIVDELAIIHSDRCKGCRKCVSVCPHQLIQMFPRMKRKAAVYCQNQDKGMPAKKACSTACIACGACVKACPVKAIDMVNNHAVIRNQDCVGCMTCVHKCPTGAILPQKLPLQDDEAA